jgi:hypothetical protein
MIGVHDDCPVSFFALRVYEGDGHFTTGSYLRSFHATPEIAEAARQNFQGGPREVVEFRLAENGTYNWVAT